MDKLPQLFKINFIAKMRTKKKKIHSYVQVQPSNENKRRKHKMLTFFTFTVTINERHLKMLKIHWISVRLLTFYIFFKFQI